MIARDEFAKFMFHLRKAVPTYSPDIDDKETIDIWYKAIASHDIEELRNVYVYIRDHEKHFPSIARIKELLLASNSSRFDELLALIGKHGAYRPPVVEDTMARAINRMGGWKRICDWSNDELPFRRKEFDETYRGCAEQQKLGHNAEYKTRLEGLHESSESFHVTSPPRLELAPTRPETVPESSKIDQLWIALNRVYSADLDGHIAVHLKAKGFFKLKSTPGYYYRYRSTDDPLRDGATPYRFVEVNEHMEKIRKLRGNTTETTSDPNAFDASRYSYERFDDWTG